MQGKPLWQSKTIWYTLATMLLSRLLLRYGLALDPDQAAEISYGIIMIAVIVLRAITKVPIVGVVARKPRA